MTPGAALYRIRKQFEGGLSASWYREVVRPRILQTPSLLLPERSEFEVHVLTSQDDWLNLIWALKSFLHFSECRPALCIHEDGSLPGEVIEILKTHFVGARLISRSQADGEVLPTLGAYPRCRAFRVENNLALKVFDLMHYANSSRVMLIDSDVLTFRKPVELLSALSGQQNLNWFNRDIQDAYTDDREKMSEVFGFAVAEKYNSGLCAIQTDSLQLDRIEYFLDSELLDGHFWRIEQTLFCLTSSEYGCEPLPEGYDVLLEKGISGKPVKHYVGRFAISCIPKAFGICCEQVFCSN